MRGGAPAAWARPAPGRIRDNGRIMPANEPPAKRPARRPTGGSLLLLVVLVGAVALLAPTINQLVAQQQRIRALEEEIAVATDAAEALETERARWDDPSFVKSQARGRLLFVEPGDTAYTVLDTSGDRTPTAPVDVSVDQHVTDSDPAALYLDSLIRASEAEPPAPEASASPEPTEPPAEGEETP